MIVETGEMVLMMQNDELIFARGSMADYRLLSRHHYKSQHPGGVTDVLTVRASLPPSAADRFAMRESEPLLLGVLVQGLPRLACTLRDVATNGRYLGLERRTQADLVNKEIRTIQRVVVDPRARGLGLAHRLVAHALANASTVYTEALAAMGRVNPFFEKAGMTRYERPVRKEHARLLDAFAEVGWCETDLARGEKQLKTMIEELDCAHRTWFESEMRRWYACAFFQNRRQMQQVSISECITAAREHLLTCPVYYLKRNAHVVNNEGTKRDDNNRQSSDQSARDCNRSTSGAGGQPQCHACVSAGQTQAAH